MATRLSILMLRSMFTSRHV